MGKIEIDHTGSGGGITLSSDGTSLLLGGTAIGGSALELYAENPSTPTAPNASGTNAVAIGYGSTASSTESVAIGDSTSSGVNSIAIGENSTSSGNRSTAIGRNSFAGSADATAVGAYSIATTGSYANAFGHHAYSYGQDGTSIGRAYSSGTDSFAAAIANNTSSYGATGANSIAMGYQAKATGSNSRAAGYQAIASGSNSLCLSQESTASGSSSSVIGGYGNVADFTYGFASGQYAHTNNVYGKMARANGRFTATGDAQHGTFVLRSDTTDATAEVLTSTNSTSILDKAQVNVPSNAAFAFHGTIVAKQSGSANAAAWKVEGLIVNNGGTTTLTNSATTVISNTPSWGMALSADDTNDALAITVTGAAATNIRWVATIHTSEVTYA